MVGYKPDDGISVLVSCLTVQHVPNQNIMGHYDFSNGQCPPKIESTYVTLIGYLIGHSFRGKDVREYEGETIDNVKLGELCLNGDFSFKATEIIGEDNHRHITYASR